MLPRFGYTVTAAGTRRVSAITNVTDVSWDRWSHAPNSHKAVQTDVSKRKSVVDVQILWWHISFTIVNVFPWGGPIAFVPIQREALLFRWQRLIFDEWTYHISFLSFLNWLKYWLTYFICSKQNLKLLHPSNASSRGSMLPPHTIPL